MKEGYIKMRDSKSYNIEWFYNYFLDNGGKKIGINQFNMIFGTKSLDNILQYLDHKFELHLLCDENGNVIKVVR